MIGTLSLDKDNKITNQQSTWQPPEEVRNLVAKLKKDYQTGYNINHRPFEEFNDMSLIERMNVDQKAFMAYVQPKSTDPDEAWRWHGVRPITENKIYAMAAHLIVAMMYPGIFAQNDLDEEDKESAEIMRYLVKWNIENSDYDISFLYGVIGALVNPVAYIEVDFLNVLQEIKERAENGEITIKEMVDEILSGMKFHNVPAQEIMIANPHQRYIQRQRFIWRRKFIDYDEAEALFGRHQNFQYVKAGVKAFYNESDGLFYEQADESMDMLCNFSTYYNRRKDMEVPFLNGIYMGDDDVNANPIKHRDNKNRPKYKYVKFGALPIENFYFYKSQAFRLLNDQDIADQMWRMVIDGTFLEVMTPLAVIGEQAIGSDIMFPGAVTNLPKETQIQPIGTGRNLMAGWNALAKIEQSMTESSQEEQRAGISEGGVKTAYEVAKIEQNARINLGIIGKMLIQMVRDLGDLMVDNVIMFQTVGEMEEITAGQIKMKYRTFLLPDQGKGGRRVTRKIMFEESLIGKEMTREEKLKESYKILKEQGGRESQTVLYKVNPQLFSRLKYQITIEAESWMPRNERFEMLMKFEAYDRLITNPLIMGDMDSLKAVTKDFLVSPIAKEESDKYLPKGSPQGSPLGATQRGQGKESILAGLPKGSPATSILE